MPRRPINMDTDFPLNTPVTVAFPFGPGKGKGDRWEEGPTVGQYGPYFYCGIELEGEQRSFLCDEALHDLLIQMGLQQRGFQVSLQRVKQGKEKWHWEAQGGDGEWYSPSIQPDTPKQPSPPGPLGEEPPMPSEPIGPPVGGPPSEAAPNAPTPPTPPPAQAKPSPPPRPSYGPLESAVALRYALVATNAILVDLGIQADIKDVRKLAVSIMIDVEKRHSWNPTEKEVEHIETLVGMALSQKG